MGLLRFCTDDLLCIILLLDILFVNLTGARLPKYMYDRLNENRQNSAKYSEASNRLSKVFEMENLPSARHHKTPPQYLTELYNSIADENGITRTRSPFDADVVRGFPDRDSQHQMHFYFNVSYIKHKEKVLDAEFHLFKMRPRPHTTTGRRRRESLHLIEIGVYQVLDPYNMYSRNGAKLLDFRRVSAHAHGWEVFSVKSAVDEWLRDKTKNHGFLVTASSMSGSPVNGTLVRYAQRGEHHDSKQPVLVAFTDDGRDKVQRHYSDDNDYIGISREYEAHNPDRHRKVYSRVYADRIKMLNEGYRAMNPDLSVYDDQNSNARSRAKRDIRSERVRRSEKKKSGKRSTDKEFRRNRKSICAKHKMYVDFEKIGWSGWIISPKGYNAFHCKGDCPFPLGQTQKPTNHATVQSIVHTLKIGQDVSMPCCVPNKLFAISLLYFDDDANVILKQYDDMVAANCGCH